ncbi:TonB-dependent receptor [Acidithiobacillus sp. CV18-2]|uniref:TonB-dependent receptor n=1 Tax=Igneacidithiobacillus copahuensis TaxID=2724909 RepID=A0AAE2YME8_9PROT|nr:TonB-dependent receptor [Igneacidithiobacillus copahuensis]MBU2753700.1 TonB-dependent receptor [Acidithiobacillus sp. CV18-3]MBU2758308.1 TonB-dependent receptor [Acidithiobacillus sp. BN09-2]MBU2778039.1 TonB-dependent receptor [Acidithiobacillus sp. CV18-2]MBU2796071.1 TonB-dependent receptor [Acidithiobacillus sp. VAN18-2]MBU2798006.1 TonB-dependent receptor [Acidithiobacillus sp. VAN18-4]UTV80342.1 TonB-dependent receptor [Acidithiobacillus sp. YTS05]
MKKTSRRLRAQAGFAALWAVSSALSDSVLAEDLGTVQSSGMAAALAPALGENLPGHSASAFRLQQRQIEALAGPGGANADAALGFLPGVSYNAPDALNLANVQSANKGLRVRGETAQHGAGDLLAGVPFIAGFSGPGQWLVDQEDVRSVTLYAGAVPPFLTAPGTIAGVVDSELLWPQAQSSWLLRQSIGSNWFSRSFLRWDSGLLPGGSSLFVSDSFTRADIWRGSGFAPAGRSNVALAWQQPYASGRLRLFYTHNDYRSDNYRPLTFAQSQDLARFGDLGYNATPASDPRSPEAAWYQGYNRQDFRNDALLLLWQQSLGRLGAVQLEPYGMKETGWYQRGLLQGTQPLVQRTDIDSWRWGLRLQWEKRLGPWRWQAGYWHDEKIAPHPATNSALYLPTVGGGLQFLRWSLLSGPTRAERYDSLFAEQSWQSGALALTLGGRYLWDRLPSLQAYATAGISTDSLNQALAQAQPVTALSVTGRTLGAFLPYLGFRWLLNEHWLLRASAGSNVASPGYDLWPAYQANVAALQKAGLAIQSLWDAQRLQRADQGDLALRWANDSGFVELLGYYGTFRNKSVAVFDPLSQLVYPQNVGDGRSFGASISAEWRMAPHWQIAGNGNYTRSAFSRDFQSLGGQTLVVSGLQTPDTPLWTGNLLLRHEDDAWRASVAGRYLGQRWADSLHTEPVSAYFLADLNAGHRWRWNRQELDLDIWLYNLFDRRAIGFINTGGLTVDSGANFYPLSARTLALTFNWHYH